MEAQGIVYEDDTVELAPLYSLDSVITLCRASCSNLLHQRVSSVTDSNITIRTFSTTAGDIKIVTAMAEQQQISLRKYQTISSKDSNRITLVSFITCFY